MKQITRDDLIRSKGQLETVLSALEGTGPEMTDRGRRSWRLPAPCGSFLTLSSG